MPTAVGSYTLKRRHALALVYSRAVGTHGVTRRAALRAAVGSFFSGRERRTVRPGVRRTA